MLPYPEITDILKFINLKGDDFWDFLGDNEVGWGSQGTITLIESDYIQDLITTYIYSDPKDEDNSIYLTKLEEFFAKNQHKYYVIN